VLPDHAPSPEPNVIPVVEGLLNTTVSDNADPVELLRVQVVAVEAQFVPLLVGHVTVKEPMAPPTGRVMAFPPTGTLKVSESEAAPVVAPAPSSGPATTELAISAMNTIETRTMERSGPNRPEEQSLPELFFTPHLTLTHLQEDLEVPRVTTHTTWQ